ncbi:MAG: hypothetical protein WCG97_01685 [bacterium]
MKATFEKIYHWLYYKLIFSIKVWLKRRLVQGLKLNRPVSYPFITGDGFRSFAQHIFDDISDFDPKKVLHGDIVFARIDMLHDFFKKIDPQIENRYILVSHNADYSISHEFDEYNKDKIIHWFGQNMLTRFPNTTPIPIGITNFRYLEEIHLLEKALSSGSIKKNKIVVAFRPIRERLNIKNKLLTFKNIDDSGELGKSDYFQKIFDYKFVASPEGNGPDCHRTWESMYLRSIPIVIRNTYTEYFEKIGLPIMLIENWDELSNLDEAALEAKYEELKPRFSSPALSLDYWQKTVNEYKLK